MKLNILVIGRHEEIMETLLRLIRQNEDWSAEGCLTDEEAILLFNNQSFDLVLLSSGLNEDSENRLSNHFRERQPGIRIVQHYGGGSGLLSNEIHQAFSH